MTESEQTGSEQTGSEQTGSEQTGSEQTGSEQADAAAAAEATAGPLRAALVERLHTAGAIRSDQVRSAMLAVPRHRFLPGVPLDAAYQNRAVVLKRNVHGGSMSSVSEPAVVAIMLEQLAVRPGQRVLEIGSGGYNAALLRELVGDGGAVLSVDIDPEVVARARRCLVDAGHPEVDVLCADGEFGAAGHAPFDRVIVTAGAWDLAPAWLSQLRASGRLVVPLRLRTLTRSVAFDQAGDRLVGRSSVPCGFVPMQGAGAHHERRVRLGDGVFVWLDAAGLDAAGTDDVGALDGVLDGLRKLHWTGIPLGDLTELSALDLWLACTEPGHGMLLVGRSAEAGLVEPVLPWGGSAVLDADSVGYLTTRRTGSADGVELGLCGHGPQAGPLLDRMAERIQAWDRDHRHGPGPRIEAWPAETPDDQLPAGTVLDKRHVRLVISWPALTS